VNFPFFLGILLDDSKASIELASSPITEVPLKTPLYLPLASRISARSLSSDATEIPHREAYIRQRDR